MLSLLVLSLVFTSSLILADEEERVNLAYSCLENQISQKTCSSMNSNERAFASLAVKKCKDAILSDRSSTFCWPKAGCTLKTTSLTMFALDERNVDVSKTRDWLLTQTMVPTNMQWYLEIETSSPTTCKVDYAGGSYSFIIDNERKINKDAGTCLKRTSSPYWFTISKSCYNTEFTVSCESPTFLTTLLFQKEGSSTLNVWGDTQQSYIGGSVTEKVDVLCFREGNSCNYEGSLWATFALWAYREDVKKFLPYLTANKEGNERFLPESFLYFITGKFESDLLNKQEAIGYWEVGSGSRLYDTALALWPFQYDDSVKENSKTWLMNIQNTKTGCWNNNIIDQAFILRSIWPDRNRCEVALDCPYPENQDCINNSCKYKGGEEPDCTIDEDCPEGYFCNDNNVCEDENGESECGNNIMEDGEQCDGSDFNGETCESVNYNYEGNLKCTNKCKLDTTECTYKVECGLFNPCPGDEVCQNGFCVISGNSDPVCGNNIKEDGEQCDGDKLGGETCETFLGAGWSGTLTCGQTGTWDACYIKTEGCTQGGENCEGGKTCLWNAQCSPQICDNGCCVNAPAECTTNQQCSAIEPGAVCTGGSCYCGCYFDGDCPGDKICEDCSCVSYPPEECILDTDCPNLNEICDNGECIEITECTSNQQCINLGVGDICVNNTCMYNNSVCYFDGDCPGDEICEYGECVSPNCSCVSNSDCFGSEVCIDCQCVEPQPVCVNDWDCPGSQECIAGNCLAPSNGGSEVQYCVDDEDCTGGKKCIDYVCSDNEIFDCEDEGYFCLSSNKCKGYEISSYSNSCNSPYICCSEDEELKSCDSQLGVICANNEGCVGGLEVDASDLNQGEVCCAFDGYCVEEGTECTEDYDCTGEDEVCDNGICISSGSGVSCESMEGNCKLSCGEKEEVSYTYSCEYTDDVCCIGKKSSAKGIIILIILLLLVALTVVGIIFRDKLKVYWIKLKSKMGKNKIPQRGGPMNHMPLQNKKTPFFSRIFPVKKTQTPIQNNLQTRPSQQVVSQPSSLQKPQSSTNLNYNKPISNEKSINQPRISNINSRTMPIKKTSVKSKSDLEDVLKKLKEMGK